MKCLMTTNGFIIIIDNEDYEKVSGYSWYARSNSRNSIRYAESLVRDENGSFIKMHRLIKDFPEKPFCVDHKNHNGLDNRKENLRVCTPKENARNKTKQRGSICKYKGTFIRKETQLFRGQIRVNGKLINLGQSKNEVEIAKIYDIGALTYFGDFASLNFPKENYIQLQDGSWTDKETQLLTLTSHFQTYEKRLKFNKYQVKEIRYLLETKTQAQVARIFKVNPSLIHRIFYRKFPYNFEV